MKITVKKIVKYFKNIINKNKNYEFMQCPGFFYGIVKDMKREILEYKKYKDKDQKPKFMLTKEEYEKIEKLAHIFRDKLYPKLAKIVRNIDEKEYTDATKLANYEVIDDMNYRKEYLEKNNEYKDDVDFLIYEGRLIMAIVNRLYDINTKLYIKAAKLTEKFEKDNNELFWKVVNIIENIETKRLEYVFND